jgi:hypothetical protein
MWKKKSMDFGNLTILMVKVSKQEGEFDKLSEKTYDSFVGGKL